MPNQFTSPPAHIVCVICGKTRRVSAYLADIAKFCSRECQRAGRPIKHGAARNGKRTPEYHTWQAMIDRCRNPANPFYADYGQRGIGVVDAWLSYESFIRDMGPRPSDQLTLERLDNSLGYSPENCAWRSKTAQQRNKRDNNHLTVNGETKLRIEWAELMGINHETVRGRLLRGWSPEQAVGLELAPLPRGQSVTANGETRTIAVWSATTGVNPDVIRIRLRRHWTPERAVGLEP